MLLPREQSPWNCAYVLGASALVALKKGSLDMAELQIEMGHILGRRISPFQVVSAVAWLFLLDKTELTDEGRLALCI